MENQNQTTKPTPRKPKTNRTIVPVFLASAAIFASVAGFLGVQVASGQDPMLGAKTTTAQKKNVIVRKVIKTRKIVTVVDAPAAGATSTGNGAVYASSGGGSSRAVSVIDPPKAVRLESLASTAAGAVSGRVVIVDRRGRILADSDNSAQLGSNFANRPEISAALGGHVSQHCALARKASRIL